MANDLATGLGLGLRAAEMRGRADEAEQDRELRERMAAEQLTFRKGEAAVAGTQWTAEQGTLKIHRDRVHQANEDARIAQEKQNALANKKADRGFVANEKHRSYLRDATVKAKETAAKAAEATAALRFEEEKNRGVEAGLAAAFRKESLGIQRARLEQEALQPFQKFNLAIDARTKGYEAEQAEARAGIDALQNELLAAGGQLSGVARQQWQSRWSVEMSKMKKDSNKAKMRYDRDITDLNKSKEMNLKKGGPKVDMSLVPHVDTLDKVTWNPQVRVSGTNIGGDAVQDIATQMAELKRQLEGTRGTTEVEAKQEKPVADPNDPLDFGPLPGEEDKPFLFRDPWEERPTWSDKTKGLHKVSPLGWLYEYYKRGTSP